MRKKSNKERILDSLLESSKMTGELTIELGYVNSDGTPSYHMASDDFDKLKEIGWIEGKEIKLGKCKNDPTLNSIVISIQKQIQTLEKYPDLISKMQKNDLICENIFREHLDLIYSSDSSQKDGREQTEVTPCEKTEKSFKEKLQSSPKFFRLFLTTDKNELIKKLMGFLESDGCMMDSRYNQDPNNWMEISGINFDIDKISRVCAWRDTFKKQCTEEGREELKQTKDKLLNEERVDEFIKYTKTEREFSDERITKLKTDVTQLLNQVKKEISNTKIEKLKESIDDVWILRAALINYLIETKNEISDAEVIKKLRNSGKKHKIGVIVKKFR